MEQLDKIEVFRKFTSEFEEPSQEEIDHIVQELKHKKTASAIFTREVSRRSKPRLFVRMAMASHIRKFQNPRARGLGS